MLAIIDGSQARCHSRAVGRLRCRINEGVSTLIILHMSPLSGANMIKNSSQWNSIVHLILDLFTAL